MCIMSHSLSTTAKFFYICICRVLRTFFLIHRKAQVLIVTVFLNLSEINGVKLYSLLQYWKQFTHSERGREKKGTIHIH